MHKWEDWSTGMRARVNAPTPTLFAMTLSCFSTTVALNWGRYCPPEGIWKVCRHFWLMQLGKCCWHLVGESQECCWTSYNATVPNLLAPGTGFTEDNFSMDLGVGDDFRMIQVHYIQAHLLLYSLVSNRSGPIPVHSLEVGDPCLNAQDSPIREY